MLDRPALNINHQNGLCYIQVSVAGERERERKSLGISNLHLSLGKLSFSMSVMKELIILTDNLVFI